MSLSTQRASSSRPAKTSRALEVLNGNVERIRDSREWQAVLRLRSRLHRYSFSNSLLILSQCPEATMVAGYRRWQELGRQVRKGERSIAIMAPLVRKDDDGSQHVFGFRTASVFDISQTDGEPLPEPPAPERLEGNEREAERALARLVEHATAHGIPVEFTESVPGGALGMYSRVEHSITVLASLSPLQRLKTAIHEVAHAFLHAKDREGISRERGEIEAETVAFLVSDALGLDTGAYSFHYVAHWMGDAGELLRAGDEAVRLADALADALTSA